MIDNIKPNEAWTISQKEAEDAIITKCAHLHISCRTLKSDTKYGEAVFSWWECDAGCGTRFIPIDCIPAGVMGISFLGDEQHER